MAKNTEYEFEETMVTRMGLIKTFTWMKSTRWTAGSMLL